MPHTPLTAIIGTGIIGIATAYFLAKQHHHTRIVLIDRGQPMGFTSAQSGENYRNWWPHPAMVDFTNRSIDLLEQIAQASKNQITMNRRGYALATRRTDIDDFLGQLRDGLGEQAKTLLRFHTSANSATYAPFTAPDWETAPQGVDIVQNRKLIQTRFPQFAPDVQAVIHIRRGGDISGQQLGMYMLDYLRNAGVKRMIGDVGNITAQNGFQIDIATTDGRQTLHADRLINAAGPFADHIAQMLGVTLPIVHTFQQKIAFEDREGAIPRDQPFAIDLDGQKIDWADEERALLQSDPEHAWMAGDMPGAIHCRPDGGDRGRWVKLGWAYNTIPAPATWEPQLDDTFPEIVLRGAARLNPALRVYYGRLPRTMHHYGGWYSMTDENWPLIGPMGPDGAFMNCAMSGFGTMAACAAGELCAAWVAGAERPSYAQAFSLARYQDTALLTALRNANKGVL